MSSSPAAPSLPEPHQQLHQRLVDGDPTAPADLLSTFLDPLLAWLTEHNHPRIHPDFIFEAAERALLDVIRNPTSYQPAKGSLEAYLRRAAEGDLRNLLRDEARHRHTPLQVVELSDEDGKYLGEDDDPSFGLVLEEELVRLSESVSEDVRAGLSEEEARALELLLRQERRTRVYAEACGFADRPPEEQRRLVKQIKDRLKKRLERQGEP
jgi:DNA-directed RNA polymerase specialized sigma24 family protein